jgi:hypothetical protein
MSQWSQVAKEASSKVSLKKLLLQILFTFRSHMDILHYNCRFHAVATGVCKRAAQGSRTNEGTRSRQIEEMS